MALFSTLFTGFSGIRNHQSMMDVIGNNIANVNTIGFKSSRITFSDALNQFIQTGTKATSDTGGTNSFQIGLGVKIHSIDRNWNQGTLERTGIETDLALQGPGLFVLKKDGQTYYTRAGSFEFDSLGRLVSTQNGAIVQGKLADRKGVVQPNSIVGDLMIDSNMRLPAVATDMIKWGGNLDSRSTLTRSENVIQTGNINSGLPGPFITESTVYNEYGDSFKFIITYTKTANPDEYDLDWEVQDSNGNQVGSGQITPIQFEDDGAGNFKMNQATLNLFDGINNRVNIAGNNLNFIFDPTAITQNSAANSLTLVADEGREATLIQSSINIFDSLGNSHQVTIKFTKIADNQWTWTASVPGTSTANGQPASISGTVVFNKDGSISPGNISPSNPQLIFDPSGNADQLTINLDFGKDMNGITQTAVKSNMSAISQNGSSSAALSNIKVDQYGNIIGLFSNGTTRTLAQIMIASFTNTNGLLGKGDNLFVTGANSGEARISSMNEESGTVVLSGVLEQSNVDLSEEFTRMIISQRGFQANARVITTADSLLQELSNLIR